MRIFVLATLVGGVVLATATFGAQTPIPMEDVSKVKLILARCDTGDYRFVVGVVAKDIDLADDNIARQILERGARLAQADCARPSGLSNIDVGLFRGDPRTLTEDKFGFRARRGRPLRSLGSELEAAFGPFVVRSRNYDKTLTWREHYNAEKISRDQEARNRLAQEQAAKARADFARQKEAADADFARQKEAADAAAKQKLDAFLKRAPGAQLVKGVDFIQNPFPFVGKVIVVPLNNWIWEATSPTSVDVTDFQSRFGGRVTGLPATLMTAANFSGRSVIALRVVGIRSFTFVHYQKCDPMDACPYEIVLAKWISR